MDERKAFVGHQVLMLALILINCLAPAICQDGFLSIDCGSDVDYEDNTTGIKWETDDKYISTGKSEHGITFPSRYVHVVNRRQVSTLRYFDDDRSRHCYVLPVKHKYSYLLRANFFYGNWGKAWGVNFRVYLNATYWWSITLDSVDVLGAGPSKEYIPGNIIWIFFPWNSYACVLIGYCCPALGIARDEYYYLETMVYSPGTQLNFCLVKITGTPFISSLELRELSYGMYWTIVGTDTYLSLVARYNAGAPLAGPQFVRYPDDLYDRIWLADSTYNSSGVSASVITRARTNISFSNAAASNQPPIKVMEDAWIYYGGNRSTYAYYHDFDANTSTSMDYFNLDKGTRYGIASQKFYVYGYFQELDGNASEANVRGMQYIVNGDIISPFNTTDQPQQIGSVFAISTTKYIVNITIASAPWSKLDAMLNAYELYYLSDFNTSATVFQDLDAVAGLQTRFNLTDWTGDPCFPVPYDWLQCNLDPSTPAIARVTKLFLTNASRTMKTIGPTPIQISDLTALTYLNLSYNSLTALPTGLKDLKLNVLDVSNNLLGGDIDNFFQAINLETLNEIHAADNQFEGQFRIDSLVQRQHVEIWNFDRNLNINGILNLSAWQTSLLAAVQGGRPGIPIFSLVDNKITDIYPKLDALEPTIEAVLKLENGIGQDTGILLGGNPFCIEAKSKSLAQKYLCRSSTGKNDTLFPASHKKSNGRIFAIAFGTCMGGFILLAICIFVPVLWHLRKQTYALLDIQEALAKQQVQPPFYSYTELRAATDDFSPFNKLGEGAFGAVYKAVGVEGKVLAVKKLKITRQVMTEFLNEVVLITGIKHRNLVQLKGCCIQGKQRILVYEYAENGNLAEALWGHNIQIEQGNSIKLDWHKRFNICVGVARGLAYLHEELQPRIIHRDIKPANILIGKNLNAKIADFGLARHFLDDQSQADFSHFAGTMGYFAPEYATQGQLTEKADVFSFGVLLLEIVSGRKCIDRSLPFEKVFLLNLTKVLSSEGRLLDLLDTAIRDTSNYIDGEVLRVIDIAQLCLEMEPTKRPTMSEIVIMLQGSMDVKVSDSQAGSKPTFSKLSEPYPSVAMERSDSALLRSCSLEMTDPSAR